MGKDLNGNELGRGISQRADGRYNARKRIGDISISIYDKDKKRIAKRLKIEVEKAKQEKKNKELTQPERTLNEWFEYWYENYKKPMIKETCWNSYRRQFVNFFGEKIGNMYLKDILQMHIQQAIIDLSRDGKTQGTIKDSLCILRQCFDVAVANRLVLTNPAIGLSIKETPVNDYRVMSKDEQKFFLEILERKNHWYKEMFQFMLCSGVRIGECGGLRIQDIDFLGKKVYIRHSLHTEYHNHNKIMKLVSTKNEKNRIIPFFGETEDILRRQLKKREELKKELGDKWRTDEEYGDILFVTSQGSPVIRHIAEERLTVLSKQLNEIQIVRAIEEGRPPVEFKRVRPHDLRHTFATRLMEKRMPMEIISQILGHTDIRTTQIYVHVLEELMVKEVEKIGDMFNFD